jgi:hypothetical protein
MNIGERLEAWYKQAVEGHDDILLRGREVIALGDELARLREIERQHVSLNIRYKELHDREQWIHRALRFYADQRSYQCLLDENGDPSRPEILFDGGSQARVALAETEGPRVY